MANSKKFQEIRKMFEKLGSRPNQKTRIDAPLSVHHGRHPESNRQRNIKDRDATNVSRSSPRPPPIEGRVPTIGETEVLILDEMMRKSAVGRTLDFDPVAWETPRHPRPERPSKMREILEDFLKEDAKGGAESAKKFETTTEIEGVREEVVVRRRREKLKKATKEKDWSENEEKFKGGRYMVETVPFNPMETKKELEPRPRSKIREEKLPTNGKTEPLFKRDKSSNLPAIDASWPTTKEAKTSSHLAKGDERHRFPPMDQGLDRVPSLERDQEYNQLLLFWLNESRPNVSRGSSRPTVKYVDYYNEGGYESPCAIGLSEFTDNREDRKPFKKVKKSKMT